MTAERMAPHTTSYLELDGVLSTHMSICILCTAYIYTPTIYTIYIYIYICIFWKTRGRLSPFLLQGAAIRPPGAGLPPAAAASALPPPSVGPKA